MINNPLPMQEMQDTQVQSLHWEDPLKGEMATLSSILAWKIPWTEEPNRLQPMGLQGVEPDWVDKHAHTIIRSANFLTNLVSELGWTESQVTSDKCSRFAWHFSPTESSGLSDSPRWELKERSLCGSSNAFWRVDNRDRSSVPTRQLEGVKDWFPSKTQSFKGNMSCGIQDFSGWGDSSSGGFIAHLVSH